MCCPNPPQEECSCIVQANLPTVFSRLLLSALFLLSAPWPESAAHAQYNGTIFGPNVYVFDSSVPGTTINTQLDAITNPSVAQAQFSTSRSAVLFKPGTYTGVSHQVGFYTSIAGLGTTPDATILNGGGLYLDVTDSSGHVTTNFWRSLENLRINIPPAVPTAGPWHRELPSAACTSPVVRSN